MNNLNPTYYRSLATQLAILLVLLLYGCAQAPKVEVVTVQERSLEESFTERAETLLSREYPIAMPVNGKIERITLEVGDKVSKGEHLVSLDVTPVVQEVEARRASVEVTRANQNLGLDTSVEEKALERTRLSLDSIRAEQGRLQPSIKAAELTLDTALKEEARVQSLVAAGALPARDLERAQTQTENGRAALAARRSERQVLASRLAEAEGAVATAQAQLARKVKSASTQTAVVNEAISRQTQAEYNLTKSEVIAPIDGLVLARHQQGPAELVAGTPLLTLGTLEDLEAECEVLSQDALRLKPGTPVVLEAGGSQSFRGELRLIQPQGFTKRSSLGVEQQRVRVRIALLDPPSSLGAGYEVWARFIMVQKTGLSLPRSCFSRHGDQYRVWRVGSDSTLEVVNIETGVEAEQHWEILGDSLSAGDRVVRNPSDALEEGAKVEVLP